MATRSARPVDSSFAQRCRVKRSLDATSTSRRAWWPIAAFTSPVNSLPANLERPVIEERLRHPASIRSRRAAAGLAASAIAREVLQ